MNGKTIFALSSAPGRSGVAVIRLSGPGAGPAVRTMTGDLPAPRHASLREIRRPDGKEVLDRGLVLWFPGPGSFTGEDVAELHIHGGRAVVTAVLDALDTLDDFIPAEPGAFTRRAFDNGLLDLTEVEGLADLIVAETEGQRRQALRQMSGQLGALYEHWRSRLIRELAYFEAQIDFPDEGDVPEDLITAARTRLGEIAGELELHLDDGHKGERLREGVRIVIAGEPNVGKSSLLNQLARRDAAIVSEQAGTTRDAIDVHLDLGGVAAIVTDTAGLRESDDQIEKEGVRRAQERIGEADIVVVVIDGSKPQQELIQSGPAIPDDSVIVANKSDLFGAGPEGANTQSCDVPAIPVSALTGSGLDVLIEELGGRAQALAGTGGDVVLTRLRHRRALEDCRNALRRVLEGDPEFPELIGEDLRIAVHALGRITGRVDVEDLLDVIFGDFCIGK